MRTIRATEARTHFYRLLDEVEQGVTVLIVRSGKTIARIEPLREMKEESRKAPAGPPPKHS